MDNLENVNLTKGEPQMSEGKKEVLVVASKLKNYIKSESGMNTSSSVFDALSAKVRTLCDRAIQNARDDGRKTVMDRDFESL
jgi:histone H3/H4